MGTPRFTPEFKEEQCVRSLSVVIPLQRSLITYIYYIWGWSAISSPVTWWVWSMKPALSRELALDALMMVV